MTNDRPQPSENNPPNGIPELRLQLQELGRRVKAGDLQAVKDLRMLLHEHPVVWQRVGDLAGQVELEWLQLASNGDPVVQESLRQLIIAMEKELGGEAPSLLKRMLVKQAVVAWLRLQRAQQEEARQSDDDPIPRRMARVRRVESCQRSFTEAARCLTRLDGRRTRRSSRQSEPHAVAAEATSPETPQSV